jgi:hypothetical protein
MNPCMKAVLSLVVVAVSLYIILARAWDEAARQWAVGTISFILGTYYRGSEPDVPR